MKRPQFRALVVISVAITALSILMFVPGLYYIGKLQKSVVRSIEDTLQKDVTLEVGSVRIWLYRGFGFRLKNLALREKGAEGREIFTADSFFVGLDLGSLIQGDIRIQRLYGTRPRIFLARDASGQVDFQKLFSLENLEGHSLEDIEPGALAKTLSPFLWEDRIVLNDAEILIRDTEQTDTPVIWVRSLDIMMKNQLEEEGSLHVAISGQVRRPVDVASFSLEGDIKGWQEANSVSELSSSLNLRFSDVALSGIASFLPGFVPGDKLEGKMRGDLAYEGSLLLPGKCHLELHLSKPVWHAPRLYAWDLSPSQVSLHSSFDLGRDRLSFVESEIDIGGQLVTWSGRMSLAQGKISHIDLLLKGNDLELMTAKRYIPVAKIGGHTWPFLEKMVKGGRVKGHARLKGAPEDFSRLGTPQGKNAFYLWIRFKDATVVLPVDESYLPFHSTNGILELSKGILTFVDFSTWYGKSHITEAKGTIRDIHHPKSFLNVTGKAKLDIPEAVSELDHGIFPEAVREISRGLHDVSGQGNLGLTIDLEYGRKIEEHLGINGEVTLEDVEAEHDSLVLPLKNAAGNLCFTDSSVSSIDIALMAGRSPVKVHGQVKFREGEQDTKGQINIDSDEVQAGDLAVLVGGDMGVRGIFATRGKIFVGGDGSWEASIQGKDLEVSAGKYVMSAEELRAQLEGKAGQVRFRMFDLVLEGNAISGKGNLNSLDPVQGFVKLRSPSLNVTALFARKREINHWKKLFKLKSEPDSPIRWSDESRIRLEFDCEKLSYNDSSWEEVFLRGGVTGNNLIVEHARANVKQGRVRLKSRGRLDKKGMPFVVDFWLIDVDQEELFRVFKKSPELIEGSLSMEGRLHFELKPSKSLLKNMEGEFRVNSTNSTIRGYQVTAKVLTLINVTKWSEFRLSDLKARGIPCHGIQGDFIVDKGLLMTDNLSIDTSIALAEVQGTFDFLENNLNLYLSLRPMEPLGQVLDRLPVVGRVLSGPDESVVIFNYRIEGPLKEPEVSLVPLSNLTDWFNSPFESIEEWLDSLGMRLQRGRQSGQFQPGEPRP